MIAATAHNSVFYKMILLLSFAEKIHKEYVVYVQRNAIQPLT